MTSLFRLSTVNLPPGPKGHFIFGNLPEYKTDPLGFLTKCAGEYADGDVIYLRLPYPAYLLTNPTDIQEVMSNINRFAKSRQELRSVRPVLGNGLVTSEGGFWHRQRQLVQPAFHRERIAAYGNIFTTYTDQLLSMWQDGEIRDIYKEMENLSMKIVGKTLFDTDVATETKQVQELMVTAMEHFDLRSRHLLLSLLPESFPTPENLRFRKALHQLDDIIYNIIQRHRAGGEDKGDLLSMLLQARYEDDSQMSDQQLRDEVVTLFLAGHDTTSFTLSWSLLLLSQHFEVQAKLIEQVDAVLGGRTPTVADVQQLDYTEWVLRETMRLFPPVWIRVRTALQDCEFGGYHLPSGSSILVSQWVMQRSPRYFNNPEAFNPDRWANNLAKKLPTYAYFPFSGGPRVCIGQGFAMLEMVLILTRILQKFQVTLAPGYSAKLWPSFSFRPRNGVQLQLTKR
jgi:cytochrome P450